MFIKLVGKILTVTVTSLVFLAIAATPLAAEEPIDSTEYPYCCHSSSGWNRGRSNPRYNPNQVETINGEVVRVDSYSSNRGTSQGIHLLVSTGKETIDVHLAPSWYLEERDFAIAPEDKITITGSKIDLNGEQGIIARQIKKGNESLILRDRYGYPLWRRQGGGWRQYKMSNEVMRK